jgi:DNA replication and repair protein RecF
MSVVTKLSVYNFRSHNQLSIKLSPNITVITGDNGVGKTSLIEAIYIALRGVSFKGRDADIIQQGCSWWRIELKMDNNLARTACYNSLKETQKKQFIINDKISYRLSPTYKYPVVLFEPDDLKLLHGSPTRRRQFIDTLISQLDPQYLITLHKHERALKQRNTLIKNRSNQESLFTWNISLSQYGAYIIKKRLEYIEIIQNNLQKEYNNISHTSDTLSISYSHQYTGNIIQHILNDLNNSYQKDLELGCTTTGPHRHDVLFLFNNTPAMTVASRGEIRSIVLALKFIEVDIIYQQIQKTPVILLDDVFSELDNKRQQKILSLCNDYQIIITSALTSLNITKHKRRYLEQHLPN